MKDKKLAIISIIVIAAAVTVLLFSIYGGVTADTAAVTLPSAGIVSGTDADSLADVNPKTVQAVIKTLSRPDSYSRTVTAEDYWSGGGSTTTLKVWVSGGSTRINTDSADGAENILVTSDGVYIWYDGSKDVFFSDKVSSTTADRWMRALTYESLLSLDASRITGAGYTEYAGENCIWAEYSTPQFGYREREYISVANGLLMGVETYDGDTLIYRTTSGVPTLAAPDAGLFTPPKK